MANEYKIHVAIVEHIASAFPMVKAIHIPNQTRSATEAYFNKKLGVVPGASDLILAWQGGNVGALEIKAPGGVLASNQNKFLSWAHSVGWKTGVARSVGQAHSILKGWGLTPVHDAVREPDLRTDEEKKRDAFNYFKPAGK